jgi:hypothetical protein
MNYKLWKKRTHGVTIVARSVHSLYQENSETLKKNNLHSGGWNQGPLDTAAT